MILDYSEIFLGNDKKDEIASVVEDIQEDDKKTTESKVKSAKAITDLMLGLMDFKIGRIICTLFRYYTAVTLVVE